MADILIVECLRDLPDEQLQHIFDCVKAQKETGVILLPPYLKAQIVPDDVEIKFIDENGKEKVYDEYDGCRAEEAPIRSSR